MSEALLALDGRLGLAGWQWLFLIEGLPAVVLGLLALVVLTDRPERRDWLAPDDRDWLARTHGRGAGAPAVRRSHDDLAQLRERAGVAPLSGVLFMHSLVKYGIFLWLPKMLQDVVRHAGFALSTITAIPFGAALVAMVLVGRHSDRTGERKLHVAACARRRRSVCCSPRRLRASLWLLVLSFTLSQMAQRSMVGPFWALPPIFLGGTAAAAGIALINAIGNLGGFVGPAHGVLRDSDRRIRRRAAGALGRAGHRGPARAVAEAAVARRRPLQARG